MILPPACALNHPGSSRQNSPSPTGSRIASLEAKMTWSLRPSHTSDTAPPNISLSTSSSYHSGGGGGQRLSLLGALSPSLEERETTNKDCHPHSSRTFRRSGIALRLCELGSGEAWTFYKSLSVYYLNPHQHPATVPL